MVSKKGEGVPIFDGTILFVQIIVLSYGPPCKKNLSSEVCEQ